jgi:hypothetical protein
MNNPPVPAVVQGGELRVADPVLTKYAAEIRRLRKRAQEDIIEIGRYLDQAQKHAGHGTCPSACSRPRLQPATKQPPADRRECRSQKILENLKC